MDLLDRFPEFDGMTFDHVSEKMRMNGFVWYSPAAGNKMIEIIETDPTLRDAIVFRYNWIRRQSPQYVSRPERIVNKKSIAEYLETHATNAYDTGRGVFVEGWVTSMWKDIFSLPDQEIIEILKLAHGRSTSL